MSGFLQQVIVIDGRGLVLLTCSLYIVGLVTDFGGNLGEPIYEHLQAQIADLIRRLRVSPDYAYDAHDARLTSLHACLLGEACHLASDLKDKRGGRFGELFGWSLRMNATTLERVTNSCATSRGKPSRCSPRMLLRLDLPCAWQSSVYTQTRR